MGCGSGGPAPLSDHASLRCTPVCWLTWYGVAVRNSLIVWPLRTYSASPLPAPIASVIACLDGASHAIHLPGDSSKCVGGDKIPTEPLRFASAAASALRFASVGSKALKSPRLPS